MEGHDPVRFFSLAEEPGWMEEEQLCSQAWLGGKYQAAVETVNGERSKLGPEMLGEQLSAGRISFPEAAQREAEQLAVHVCGFFFFEVSNGEKKTLG